MKRILLIINLLTINIGFAQVDDYYQTPEINESQPYFKVLNKNSKIDRIPLLLTTVDIEISGFMAEVTVVQYYKNDGDLPLEAQYVFPGSTDAAVHSVEMTVGDRVIAAEIQKKKEAKETYLKAKKEGKTTSLLEQSDPGLFTMNLANIMPGDDITVSLSYTEKIIPSQGKYKFIYPAVGRPSVLAKGNQSPQHYSPGDNMGFDLSLRINSPITISDIKSQNHEIEIDYESNQSVNILLSDKEQFEFIKDFIFEYDLRGQALASGLLIHQEKKAGYFLLTVQPPAAFKSDQILAREYIFVVDSSGSMDGLPMENAKFITESLISDLAPEEYFNVVLFAGGSKVFNENSQQVNQSDIRNAIKMVSVSDAGGGTDLFGALEEINKIPRIDGISRTLVIMTDGAISVPDKTIDLLTQTANQNVFVIGVSGGYSNDVATIKSLALAGQGQPFFIQDNDQDIAEIQQKFLDYVRYPILSDIKVEAIGFEGLDIQPTHVVDLFAERPVFITGKYEGAQRGSIRITGQGNGLKYDQFFDFDGIQTQNNEAIKFLWAREKINLLSLKESENEAMITAMGLDHHLMTPFTSFVAVDQLVRNESGTQKVTQQPSISGYGYSENNSLFSLDRLTLDASDLPKNMPLIPDLLTKTDQLRSSRRNITFIMGVDKPGDNMFYRLATDLFTNHPDYRTSQLVHLNELDQIKTYLRKHHNGIPWGVVNIVAHSSPWSGIQQDIGSTSVAKSLNYFNVNTLNHLKSFSPLDNSVVDSLSEIRVIGCAIGSQKNFLRSLEIYFGGNDSQRPQVNAPNGYVYLKNNTHQSSVYALTNPWFLSRSELVSNDLKFLNLIKKHSPDSQYINAQFWTQLPIEINLPLPYFNQISKPKAMNLAKKQTELVNFLEDLSASVNDFDWQIVNDNKGKPTLNGKSILVKFKLPDNNYNHLLQELNFNDPSMMSNSR